MITAGQFVWRDIRYDCQVDRIKRNWHIPAAAYNPDSLQFVHRYASHRCNARIRPNKFIIIVSHFKNSCQGHDTNQPVLLPSFFFFLLKIKVKVLDYSFESTKVKNVITLRVTLRFKVLFSYFTSKLYRLKKVLLLSLMLITI